MDTPAIQAARQVLSLTPSALIELFSLDLRPVGEDTILYFHNGSNGLRGSVKFQGITYTPLAISVTGFEVSTTGEPARPKLTMSNIGSFTSMLSISTSDLVGAVLRRTKTWRAYLDDSPSASPVTLGDPDVYTVEQRTRETRLSVEFELSTPFDLDNVRFPIRKVVSGYCPFEYRGPDCNWAGRHCVSDSRGNLMSGASAFAGNWSNTAEYQSPMSVGYTDGGYYGIYECTSPTPISGVSFNPTNVAAWVRRQRHRGEYSSAEFYSKDDVVFVLFNNVPVYFIATWPGVMPPNVSPPNPTYWTSDTCLKFLRHCKLRFDPLNTKQTPLAYGGFPGTINVPQI